MGEPSDGRCVGCRHPSGSTCGGCGTFVNDGWDGRSPADLTTRLLAALDAEQRIAEAATPGGWYYVDGRVKGGLGERLPLGDRVFSWDGIYIAYQHPARTLRRIAALRRIVERHLQQGGSCTWCCTPVGDADWPCVDVLDVAAALGVEP